MADLASEEFAVCAERLYNERRSVVDATKSQILGIINKLIKDGNEESIKCLYDIYSDNIFWQNYKGEKETAYIYVALHIHDMERAGGRASTIFSHVNDIDEVIELIREIKLHLWRWEFVGDRDSCEWLCEKSAAGLITMECMAGIMLCYCVDKRTMLKKLTKEYELRKMNNYAEYMHRTFERVVNGF